MGVECWRHGEFRQGSGPHKGPEHYCHLEWDRAQSRRVAGCSRSCFPLPVLCCSPKSISSAVILIYMGRGTHLDPSKLQSGNSPPTGIGVGIHLVFDLSSLNLTPFSPSCPSDQMYSALWAYSALTVKPP